MYEYAHDVASSFALPALCRSSPHTNLAAMSHMSGEFAVSLPKMQQCGTKRGRARVTSDGKHKPMDKQYGIGFCLVLLYAISPQFFVYVCVQRKNSLTEPANVSSQGKESVPSTPYGARKNRSVTLISKTMTSRLFRTTT